MRKILSLAFTLLLVSPIMGGLPPERVYLLKEYFPSLRGRVLFVGVDKCNSSYYTYTQEPKKFETIDHLKEKAPFGSPYKHYVADFLTFEPGYKYDHISLFGVLGHDRKDYNMKTNKTVDQALLKAHRLLKVGGTLLLGPHQNDHKSHNRKYWNKRVKRYPLKKYQIIENRWGPENLVWWGRKTQE